MSELIPLQKNIHYCLQMEKAVLGMCLLFDSFGIIHSEINEETFYYQDNAKVFKAIKTLFDYGAPINARTVAVKMTELNYQLSEGNTEWYLTTLEDNITNPSSLIYEAITLKKMWRKRELKRLTSAGIEATGDERKQIRDITNQLNAIQGADFKQEWYTMEELMFNLIKHQEEMRSGNKSFITTGFKGIDRENAGFSAGQLIVIGARPSVGKSAIMGKMALSIAGTGKKVGIISLEMHNNEIASRLASLETDIDFSIVYRNLFRDLNDGEKFYNIIANQTIKLPVFVSDKTKVDVNEIRAKAQKLKYQHGLDCLFVDYLQLVDSPDNKQYNREQEVSKISRGLKLLAMEMEIPVVVLCQLNRGTTQAKDAAASRPQLHHLRESGAIEQDADVVMMLHSDYKAGFTLNAEGGSTEREADLLGLKWRNGATFNLMLDFDPPKMKFSEKRRHLIPVREITESNPF